MGSHQAAFRTTYLRHEEITALLRTWQKEHPKLVRLTSIGKSPEGRELIVAEIGPDPDRIRPAAWIDGNMHATELCGSSVALALAEDVLELHLEKEGKPLREDHPAQSLPPHVRDGLRDTLLYVLPRMSPDGAETVLNEGRYVRSNPRDSRYLTPTPRWKRCDVDGDGRAHSMRKKDPTGEYVEHPNIPGLMVQRKIEDEGPFYKVWPEGMIENFDGQSVPDPHYLSDNDVDLNRNFPMDWRPEHDQLGAGAYPASEPEARAVVEFHTRHPNVFYWLNLHTYGGVYIRPLGNGPDKKMDIGDRALYRHIEEICETYGGYPMVSGYEEFLYEPDKPLYGDLTDFAYHQRGTIAYVCELWDIFQRLGMPRLKPFVDHYSQLGEKELVKLAELDKTINNGRMFQPFKPFRHPQLGDIEVGGFEGLIGLSNPPYELINEVCHRQSAAFLRVMAWAPRLSMLPAKIEKLAPDTAKITVEIMNTGYLPTYVLPSAKRLALDARIFLDAKGTSVKIDPTHARLEVGHLEGWGRGRHFDSAFHPGSKGTSSTRTLTIVAHGKGKITLRASGLRVGAVEQVIEI